MAKAASGTVTETRKANGRIYYGVKLTLETGRPGKALAGVSTRAEADARLESIVTFCRMLEAADLSAEILTGTKIYERAAAAKSAREIEVVARLVSSLCSGRVLPTKATRDGIDTGITFEQFGKLWTDGKLAEMRPDYVKKKKTATDDAERLELYVYPHVRDLPAVHFSKEHAIECMSKLPAKLQPASRRHVAQVMHRLCSLLAWPFEVIKANPLPEGFLPPVRGGKDFDYLYPDEDRQLLGCRDVSILYRLVFGFLSREGMRCSEAAGLTWTDCDLVRGAVNLPRNKTNDPRRWAMTPGTVAALSKWRELNPDTEYVFTRQRVVEDRKTGETKTVIDQFDFTDAARALRDSLNSAEVKRATLHTSDEARGRLRAHDLRATFVTSALAEGKSETWIMDRTGHKSSTMIHLYRRKARAVEEMNLGPLSPLHKAIAWPKASVIVAAPAAPLPALPARSGSESSDQSSDDFAADSLAMDSRLNSSGILGGTRGTRTPNQRIKRPIEGARGVPVGADPSVILAVPDSVPTPLAPESDDCRTIRPTSIADVLAEAARLVESISGLVTKGAEG